jgi:hypothetical protein
MGLFSFLSKLFKPSVDSIIADIEAKVAKLHIVADAHAEESKLHAEVIAEKQKLIAYADAEFARAKAIALKLKGLGELNSGMLHK